VNALGECGRITAHKNLEQQFLRSQRMESIGTLAGGIAHDFNNILQPITLAMDFLRTQHPDSTSHCMLDLVTENTRRATSLVRQVLSFARGVDGERASIHPSGLPAAHCVA
jgi:nitrogen-specific signal transduction histidine kinase